MKFAAGLLTYALRCAAGCGAVTFGDTVAKAEGTARAAAADPIAPKPVASSAVFYEEDWSDPNNKRLDGSVRWYSGQVPSNPGQKPETAILADIEFPGQRMTIHCTLRRNADKSLAATHVFEISFQLPIDFPHGGIRQIPRVLMKVGETARGEPLSVNGLNVTANQFLIGLSSLDMQRNAQLLKERSWFDIPIIYDDGTHALIAIEKGTRGEQVFAAAFAAWGDGAPNKARPQPPAEPAKPPLARREPPTVQPSPPQPPAEPAKPPLPGLEPFPARPSPPQSRSDLRRGGTGFIVSKDGAVLTNDHVVDRCTQIKVRNDSSIVEAKLLRSSKSDDLALLGTGLKPTVIANWRAGIRQGEDVVIFGFPWAGVLAMDGNVTAGNVVALTGINDNRHHLQISAPVQPGNSGGPVMDRGGNVVGVVISRLAPTVSLQDLPQNVNFAIKSSVALDFLHVTHVEITRDEKATASMTTPDLVDYAKGFTVHVICEK